MGAMDVQYEIVCKCRAWGSCYLRRDSLDWTQSQFRSILVVTIAQTKVLVVDDEPELVQLLKDWLEEDGFEVFTATESAAGLRLFFQNHPDLTIADLRMPGMDGFQFITRIREMSDAHVLVLTALESEEYMIRGLDLGADDFLVKPVSRRALLARIRALLRRASPAENVPTGYSDGIVTLNFLTHEAEIRGEPVSLRPTEFRLLAFLSENQERVVGHKEILEKVWGDPFGSLDSLKWYIHSLRGRLEEDVSKPQFIVTVPGVGYRYRLSGPELSSPPETGESEG